jgi:hypothetical protein
MQDHIVGWVQGLAAHIEKYERAQEAARQSDHPRKCPVTTVQVEIDPASDVGAMMAKLRDAIDPADLADIGIEAQPGIMVRCGIVGSDLGGLRQYLRSLDPFEITFGKVGFFPASAKSENAAVLKVDVISPVLEEINIAMEQHANCAPADSNYLPHAIVAYVKPKAVKKYVGKNLLAGRTMEVSALSIRPKDGKPKFVQLVGAPAPWKEDDYRWPGDEVKPPQRKRAKSSLSRGGAKKRPRGGH